MSVVVVVPSRGRPAEAWRSLRALQRHAVLVSTRIILAVDEDDPRLHDYWGPASTADIPHEYRAPITIVTIPAEGTGNLVKITNTTAMRVVEADHECILGYLNDDHLMQTPGWDKLVQGAMTKPGLVYGKDGIHDERLPTAPFWHARIIRALGWYALPGCEHSYIDDAWRTIADALNRRYYVPELFTEHLHWSQGKAEMDEGYERVGATALHDREAYELWRYGAMKEDIKRVRRAL